jgi:hypothetical protein
LTSMGDSGGASKVSISPGSCLGAVGAPSTPTRPAAGIRAANRQNRLIGDRPCGARRPGRRSPIRHDDSADFPRPACVCAAGESRR